VAGAVGDDADALAGVLGRAGRQSYRRCRRKRPRESQPQVDVIGQPAGGVVANGGVERTVLDVVQAMVGVVREGLDQTVGVLDRVQVTARVRHCHGPVARLVDAAEQAAGVVERADASVRFADGAELAARISEGRGQPVRIDDRGDLAGRVEVGLRLILGRVGECAVAVLDERAEVVGRAEAKSVVSRTHHPQPLFKSTLP
jgi:hypothetical protein